MEKRRTILYKKAISFFVAALLTVACLPTGFSVFSAVWDGDVDRDLESGNWIRFEDYFVWKNYEQYMNICKQYSLAINQFNRAFRMDLFSYCVGVDCGEWELDYGKKKYYDIYKKYCRFMEQKEQLKFRKNSYIEMMARNRLRMLSDKDAFEYNLRMREVIKTIKQANI